MNIKTVYLINKLNKENEIIYIKVFNSIII